MSDFFAAVCHIGFDRPCKSSYIDLICALRYKTRWPKRVSLFTKKQAEKNDLR